MIFVKIFKRIILAILIISILLIGSITLMGYIMYHNAISQTSIADKIAEIKSNENYTSINDIPDNFKNAIIANCYCISACIRNIVCNYSSGIF